MTIKLFPKQKLFCEEYLKDLNATQAAIRSGYSQRTAKEQAARLLSNVNVSKTIQEAMAKRVEKVQVDAAYVVRRLIEIDNLDVSEILNDDMGLKPLKEWPRPWRQFISGFDISEVIAANKEDGDKALVTVLKKIRWPDKVKNLELLGRHFGIFNDKLNVNLTDGLAERLARAKDK